MNFINIEKICRKYLDETIKIRHIGGEIHLVGGSVRDSFLNIDNNDIDFCITGLTKFQFMELFPEAKITGEFFPVFRLHDAEFAFARKEVKNSKGHNGFSISANPLITIEDDLARRDLTINAMAINILTGELIDMFNGIVSIEDKIIRHINSDAFKEDPLRVYRVARFAATLNFNVSEETLKLMKKMKDSLQELSQERVFSEMKKALKSKNPRTFFDVFQELFLMF